MFKRFLAAFLLSLTAIAAHAESNYRVLSKPGRVDKPGMIEVREFFWYGCRHCYSLEPHLVKWLQTKPADVNFIRTPAALNPQWEVNARGYYAVDMMGLTAKTHAALFHAIHVAGERPFDQQSLARFYSKLGVDPAAFNGNYNSFAVSGQVAKGRKLAQDYGLEGVPAVVVNGKYVISGDGPAVISTLNELIAKERAATRRK
ncbi:MAG: thiol:disulfide interchange protein DsbA/DsbL [Moraxellaceae bacterium]|jgi:thiol:disulfide interchange protein DsbA|nr:thiol:disulfide interchange protein DsbA/DsbL [Moraxellaceae bacterium]